MKKKDLEILLEGLEMFNNPQLSLEQYPTPPVLASELLFLAYLRGDLKGVVYDLGCGHGILAIGAKLLGAKQVIGVDVDAKALMVARRNAEKLGVEIEFIHSSVEDIEGTADTVVMNPPFGIQKRYADRIFLDKALEIGKVIYSIHSRGSEEFIKEYVKPARVTDVAYFQIPMKKIYKFHRKDVEYIYVEVYRIVK